MSWEQVICLKNNGHMIGGHTRNHLRLSKLDDTDKIISEVSEDKAVIEEKLGEKITAFAYPYGSIKSISAKALKVIGSFYEYCYSGVRGNNHPYDNKLTIKREVAGFYLKSTDVSFVANGGYDWYYDNARKELDQLTSL